MARTETKDYVVREIQRYHIKLEEVDEEIQVRVPKICNRYNKNLQSEINSLDEGDIVQAFLLSDDERNHNWRFGAIVESYNSDT